MRRETSTVNVCRNLEAQRGLEPDSPHVEAFLPLKAGELEAGKLAAPARGHVYLLDKRPVLVDVSGKGDLVRERRIRHRVASFMLLWLVLTYVCWHVFDRPRSGYLSCASCVCTRYAMSCILTMGCNCLNAAGAHRVCPVAGARAAASGFPEASRRVAVHSEWSGCASASFKPFLCSDVC